MRTTETETMYFIHNGDFSGDVRIVDRRTKAELVVPFEDLKCLMAEYVIQRRMEKLETMTPDEVLDTWG